MNKIEELEFLRELRELSLGVSTHDNIEIYCRDFEAKKEVTELETTIVIRVNKTNWKKSGRYIESMFYNNRMREAIEKAIVVRFKEMMSDRASEVRREAREILGIPEKQEETMEKDHDQEGGTT